MKIVLASENPGKLKEIQDYFRELPITFVQQSAFQVRSIEERGLSFVENAILKARHAAQVSKLPALADDSGICVDALGGAPGIYSARYAGPKARDEDNIKKLLKAISSLKDEDRSARFYCALAFVRHEDDPIPIITQAQWEGRLLEEPAGENGFGYDPIFFIPALHCSAAQLEPHLKNTLSHRAQALKAFVQEFTLAQLKSSQHVASS